MSPEFDSHFATVPQRAIPYEITQVKPLPLELPDVYKIYLMISHVF